MRDKDEHMATTARSAPQRWTIRHGGLSRTLLLAFLSVVVGAVALIGIVAIPATLQAAQAQAINRLQLVSAIKETEIRRWLRERDRDLAVLVGEPEFRQEAVRLLSSTSTEVERVAAYSSLGVRLNDILEKKVSFAELFLLDAASGQAVVSTDILKEGYYHRHTDYFQQGLEGPFLQPPEFYSQLNVSTLLLARPVASQGGDVVGVLVGRANLGDLSVLMLERTGLGETGETYLVDRELRAVTRLRFGRIAQLVDTVGARQSLVEQSGQRRYENYQGTAVFGLYRWIPDLQVTLLAEQSEEEVFASTRPLVWGVLGLILVGGMLAALVGIYISRRITRPITRLTAAATEMAAGDLGQRVAVERRDEIGALSQAFDDMADQLQGLIGTLEQRVADRTHDLERRAVQLATAVDVGRAAASILELEALTRQVVELIRQRYDLYYAGLFLLDDAREYAVLEAGTGEPGRIMKEEGHRLEVGGVSMVGAACAQHQARVALDVGDEPVRFDNPHLPDTRSEMALPLMVGDRVLGALDVQSTQPSAFAEEDIAVLQLVADQVAVAIDNARKFSEEAAVVEATNPLFRVSRRLAAATSTDDVVQAIINSVSETEADGCAVVLFNFAQETEDKVETISFLGVWHRWRESQVPLNVSLPPSSANFPPPLPMTFWTLGDVSQDDRIPVEHRQSLIENEVRAVVNIPLRTGRRVIGFVDVQRATAGPFSPMAIRLYEALTDQAAVALERARLLAAARRRAEREATLRTLSDRVARAMDVQSVLHGAAEGLRRSLQAEGVYIGFGPGLEGEDG